jgi:hypothetical protein
VKKGIGDLYACESNRNVKRVFTINTHSGGDLLVGEEGVRGGRRCAEVLERWPMLERCWTEVFMVIVFSVQYLISSRLN